MTYTITADQLASISASRLQHLDNGDEAAADALGWVLTAEPTVPLTDAQIEAGREAIFSTCNPFCPCDSKTMRKAVRWAEHAHKLVGA